jgi:nucleoid-associated protein YgaU
MNESAISMILGALVVVVVGVLVYNYFSSVGKVEEDVLMQEGVALVKEEGELVPKDLPATHTVAAGEHLWAIAERYYGTGYNWLDISQENQLINPDLLAEGQSLVIPRTAIKTIEKPEVSGTAVTPEASILGNEYTVTKGDHLWDVAVRAYGDGYRWTEIWQANKELVIDPDVIEMGMVLRLPR